MTIGLDPAAAHDIRNDIASAMERARARDIEPDASSLYDAVNALDALIDAAHGGDVVVDENSDAYNAVRDHYQEG